MRCKGLINSLIKTDQQVRDSPLISSSRTTKQSDEKDSRISIIDVQGQPTVNFPRNALLSYKNQLEI